MSFSLPPLKYEKTALSPFLSENTLNFHHGKHLQAYVDTTNKLVAGTPNEGKSLKEIFLSAAPGPLFNNAAQAWNHEFYFNCISPKKVAVPAKLAKLIDDSFGSHDKFVEQFTTSAGGNFGAGWTWLVQDGGKLKIVNTTGAGNPLTDKLNPILTVDVWEHAYYLDYQNRRPDYLKAFVEHVNWEFVESNLA